MSGLRCAVVALAFLVPAVAWALSPPEPPDDYALPVGDGKFLFVMLADQPARTPGNPLVRCRFSKRGMYRNDGSTTPLWTLPEFRSRWSQVLCDDGVHMASIDGGIANEKSPKRPAVTFYANGAVIRTRDLTELVPDPSKLPEGGYPIGTQWVKEYDISPVSGLVTILTIPGDLVIYDATGTQVFRRDKGAPRAPIAGRAQADWIADLNSPDQSVRLKAAQTLGAPGAPQQPIVTALTAALADADAGVRAAAAASLAQGAFGARPAVPALIKALADADRGVRAAAARALGRINSRKVWAAPDLGRLGADPDATVREAALRALAAIGASQQLGEALASPAPDTQRLALQILAESGWLPDNGLPAAIALAGDANVAVRQMAVRLVATASREHLPTTLPVLRKALADADTGVRDLAIEGLFRLDREVDAVLPDLKTLAATKLPAVTACILQAAIQRIGRPK